MRVVPGNKPSKLMVKINGSFKILRWYQGLNFSTHRTVLKNKAIDSRRFAGTVDNAHAAAASASRMRDMCVYLLVSIHYSTFMNISRYRLPRSRVAPFSIFSS